MLRASACALLLVAMALLSGCAWHSVEITTNVFALPSHVQNAKTDVLEDPKAGTTLTEGDATSTFSSTPAHGVASDQHDPHGLGIYVHADGRTLAVAGPVQLRIACRTFGKDSAVSVEWGGMTYGCEGGELSENGRKVIGEVVRGAVAGATGSPLGAAGIALDAAGETNTGEGGP